MVARLMTFSVWLLLGGSVAYWGLQLLGRPLAMPASVTPAGDSRATQVDLSRLLGATPQQATAEPEVAQSTRLRLVGVVAPKSAKAADAGEGVALIEVDGVVRTVRVGAAVDGDLRLLRVDARSANLGLLGQAPTQVLQMSPPPLAATGSLPPAAPSTVVLGGNPNAGSAGVPLRQSVPPAQMQQQQPNTLLPEQQQQPPNPNNLPQAR